MDTEPTLKFQREIGLEQLVGHSEERDGLTFEVKHPIDRIFLNGIHVGFAGHKPTDQIAVIRPGVMTDAETLRAIQLEVQKKFGGELRRVNGAPQITDEQTLDAEEGIGGEQ